MTKTELIEVIKDRYNAPVDDGFRAPALFSFAVFLKMFLKDLKKFDADQIVEFNEGDLMPYDDVISTVEQEIVYLELQR